VNAQIQSTIGPCAVKTNMRASNCLINGIAKYTHMTLLMCLGWDMTETDTQDESNYCQR
jgi:hypothetical protein